MVNSFNRINLSILLNCNVRSFVRSIDQVDRVWFCEDKMFSLYTVYLQLSLNSTGKTKRNEMKWIGDKCASHVDLRCFVFCCVVSQNGINKIKKKKWHARFAHILFIEMGQFSFDRIERT